MGNDSWLMDDDVYRKALKKKGAKSAQKKEVNTKTKTYDIVTQIKVQQLLDMNKDKKYSNTDISKELGISISSASQITSRLSSINAVRLAGYLKGIHGSSQLFQSNLSDNTDIEIIKPYQTPIERIANLIYTNKNQIFTCLTISKKLSINLYAVIASMKTLLLQDIVKIVKLGRNEETMYQHISGSSVGIEVKKEIPEEYFTLKEFPIGDYTLDNVSIEEIRKNMVRKGTLVITNRGIRRYYSKQDIVATLDLIHQKMISDGVKNILDYFLEDRGARLTKAQVLKVSKGTELNLDEILASDQLRSIEFKDGKYLLKQPSLMKKLFRR